MTSRIVKQEEGSAGRGLAEEVIVIVVVVNEVLILQYSSNKLEQKQKPQR